jgi:hypothetical protein
MCNFLDFFWTLLVNMFGMWTESSCVHDTFPSKGNIWCAHELTKFIKKFTHVLSILLNLYIKLKVLISNNEEAEDKFFYRSYFK